MIVLYTETISYMHKICLLISTTQFKRSAGRPLKVHKKRRQSFY